MLPCVFLDTEDKAIKQTYRHTLSSLHCPQRVVLIEESRKMIEGKGTKLLSKTSKQIKNSKGDYPHYSWLMETQKTHTKNSLGGIKWLQKATETDKIF